VDLYIHFPIRLHGVALNLLRAGRTYFLRHAYYRPFSVHAPSCNRPDISGERKLIKFLTVRLYFHPPVTSCFLRASTSVLLVPIRPHTFSSMTTYCVFRGYTTAAVTSQEIHFSLTKTPRQSHHIASHN
jgi:hypothetical protein